jgi:oxaloacetate decarboxylase alpha subunit
MEEIRELVKIVEESKINEITIIEEDGTKIAIRKGVVPTNNEEGVVVEKSEEVALSEKKYPDSWKEITAPMVGTFYRAPYPDVPPFVEEGDEVEAGQTVCIIEAMKLMNKIEIEEAGVIKKICLENGSPIEYGQILFLYEPK